MTRVDGWDRAGWRSYFTPIEGVLRVADVALESLRADRIFAKAVDHQWSRHGVSCSRHEWLSRQQLFGNAESLLRAGKPERPHQRAPFLLLRSIFGAFLNGVRVDFRDSGTGKKDSDPN